MNKRLIDINRLPKQEYTMPQMEAIDIHMTQHLLAGSDIITTITTAGGEGSIGVDYGGGGDGPAHSRELDDLLFDF
ncbi:MAG: hypothetical protein J6M15_11815 [Prevotella sp.]|nr:hypothetical protein [Prevotella sp.]